MPNRMNVPPELDALIEKREESDRRTQERRLNDHSDQSATSSNIAQDETPPAHEERRSGIDRRSSDGRRDVDRS